MTKAELTEEEVATLKEANVNDLGRLGVVSTPE